MERNSNTLDAETWQAVRYQVASQGLGSNGRVRCSECGQNIGRDERAKGYVVGHGDDWRLAQVYHPECSSLMTCENVGEYDEQEGIVYGTVRYAPDIARQVEEDREVAKEEMKAIFGDDLSVIETSLPKHHLTELEMGAMFLPGQGRFEATANGGEA